MDASTQNPFREALPAAPASRLRGDRTALVVVDMQYFDAHPDWGEGATAKALGVLDAFDEYFEILRAATPQIQRLLAACRQKGVEVIHIRVAELTDDSRDVGWKQVVRGLAVPKQSKEAELLEEVKPVGDEIVISKSSSGAFATTNIDRVLRNLGINTLLFTGTSTGGCVESTARDAVDLGYEVIVVADACADSTRRAHQRAIERLGALGAQIRATEDLDADLRSLPKVDRLARSGVERAARCIPSRVPEQGSRRSPYSLIFPPALELTVEPARSALIMVDVQRWTCDPEVGLGRFAHEAGRFPAVAPFYARVESAVSRMRGLADACRGAGLLIVHVRTASYTSDGRDLAPKLRGYGFLPVPGTREIDIVTEVAPQADDIVVSKPGSGVCTGTGLDELLRNAGVETVVMAGISFDGAVEGSARSLTDRGYALILVPDACATVNDEAQKGLWGMQSGIINVMSAEDLAQRLDSQRRTQVGRPG